ncbi:MAG: hypothetical protein RLZZ252_515 [Bacteroidota bacterium]|jgi:uncharacterized protein (TIGR02453 family)
MRHLTEDFFEFFIELTLNNNKTWFDDNRKRYEKSVKLPFRSFVEELIKEVSAVDARFSSLSASDCLFRINRDIRFSKDKTPYKTHCSAALQLGDSKNMSLGGLYVEFGPESCGIYAGVYMPDKETLTRIRTNISTNLMGFRKAIEHPNFKKNFGEIRGDKNKILPSPFKELALNEPYLYNKQFYVVHPLEAEETLEPDFVARIVDIWKTSLDFTAVLEG